MDSKDFQKCLPINENIQFEWFLVQYDQNPQKLTRKIVKDDELIWNEELQKVEYNDGVQKEHVLIRDQGKLHLGYVLYKGKTKQECVEHHTYLQIICMQLLHSPHEISDIMERLHFNHSYWLLIMYSRSPMKEEQVVYGIFHKNDVIMKMDNHSHALMAFVQEQESTYKGLVVKISNDFSDMMFMMDVIRNELLKTLQENMFVDPEKKNREFHEKIVALDQRMFYESRLLTQALQAVDKSKIRLQHRLNFLRQVHDTNQ